MGDWRHDNQWGTSIDLSGCQAGLQTDARCDELACKFRTERHLQPKEVITVLKLLCPRDKIVEPKGSTAVIATPR